MAFEKQTDNFGNVSWLITIIEQNNLIQLIYIHRTRITFTLRDRFLSASAIDFKIENRIFEPNNNGQKQPK